MSDPGKIAVDFDGVIHTYHGWDGNPPKGTLVPGVVEALRMIHASGRQIVVHTARDEGAVRTWLNERGLLGLVDRVTDKKPRDAVAFFDDRGYHVESNVPYGLARAWVAWLERPQGSPGPPPSPKDHVVRVAPTREPSP